MTNFVLCCRKHPDVFVCKRCDAQDYDQCFLYGSTPEERQRIYGESLSPYSPFTLLILMWRLRYVFLRQVGKVLGPVLALAFGMKLGQLVENWSVFEHGMWWSRVISNILTRSLDFMVGGVELLMVGFEIQFELLKLMGRGMWWIREWDRYVSLWIWGQLAPIGESTFFLLVHISITTIQFAVMALEGVWLM